VSCLCTVIVHGTRIWSKEHEFERAGNAERERERVRERERERKGGKGNRKKKRPSEKGSADRREKASPLSTLPPPPPSPTLTPRPERCGILNCVRHRSLRLLSANCRIQLIPVGDSPAGRRNCRRLIVIRRSRNSNLHFGRGGPQTPDGSSRVRMFHWGRGMNNPGSAD